MLALLEERRVADAAGAVGGGGGGLHPLGLVVHGVRALHPGGAVGGQLPGSRLVVDPVLPLARDQVAVGGAVVREAHGDRESSAVGVLELEDRLLEGVRALLLLAGDHGVVVGDDAVGAPHERQVAAEVAVAAGEAETGRLHHRRLAVDHVEREASGGVELQDAVERRALGAVDRPLLDDHRLLGHLVIAGDLGVAPVGVVEVLAVGGLVRDQPEDLDPRDIRRQFDCSVVAGDDPGLGEERPVAEHLELHGADARGHLVVESDHRAERRAVGSELDRERAGGVHPDAPVVHDPTDGDRLPVARGGFAVRRIPFDGPPPVGLVEPRQVGDVCLADGHVGERGCGRGDGRETASQECSGDDHRGGGGSPAMGPVGHEVSFDVRDDPRTRASRGQARNP